MKFAAAFLALVGVVSAARKELKPLAVHDGFSADSDLGMKLLSKARRLDQGNYNANNNGNAYMDQYGNYANNWNNQNEQQFQNWYMSMHTWVKDYSIKFQGCHHVSEWNKEAEDEADVRIWTRRLVKFRLCPTYTCMDSESSGCDSGYGDYIIDIDTFLEAYLEAKYQYQEWMEEAAENNGYQYYGNDYQGDYDVSDYIACQQSDIEYDRDNNQNYNYYQGADEEDEDNWDGTLYMGPYCASQGGAIYVGLFMDDKCSQAIDSNYGRSVYYQSQGETLPFSQKSLVDMTCFPCSEPQGQYAAYNNQGDDAEDEDEVCEACENLYTLAGKCEQKLPISSNTQNNNACNYLEGIKVIRKDGTVVTTNRKSGGSRRGKRYRAAFSFVGIFSAAFVILSAYVYYLKEKLDRASIQLAE